MIAPEKKNRDKKYAETATKNSERKCLAEITYRSKPINERFVKTQIDFRRYEMNRLVCVWNFFLQCTLALVIYIT